MNELNQIKEEYIKKQQELFDEFSKKIESVKKENPNEIQFGSIYYFIDDRRNEDVSEWQNDSIDNYRLIKNNVWLNEDDCIRYNKIDKQFRQLVYDENLKNPIDWKSHSQKKYYISLDTCSEKFYTGSDTFFKNMNIYCSVPYILDLAISLIGEEDLKWYIKNYRA